MKSFTGKFTSARGWVLLIALLLGAGMMISACGEEETPAPTTPTPPPAPPPAPAPAPEPDPTGPAAPANLKATVNSSTSITWSWDAVEGAISYNYQFGPSSTAFTDTTPTVQNTSETSYTPSGLTGNTAYHLRVRAVAGTLQQQMIGDWSEPVSGTTAAPVQTRLAAPGNVRRTSRTENSITLEWDDVDDAATYEVEQREPGDEWDDANCGAADADNEVATEVCVASGLDAGTDYDFRVRGVPADGDDTHTLGRWSDIAQTRTDGTAPVQPTTPVGGGMGNLNVRWTSSKDRIEWTWDRIPDKTYDYVVLSGDGLPRMDAENPCAGKSYPEASTGSAATTADESANSPALLCVKTTNPRDSMENLSFAWAVRATADGDRPTVGAASPATTSGKATKSLTWGGIHAEGGFSYEIKVVADPERDNRITPTVPAAGSALQRVCNAGNLLVSDETDVDLEDLEATLRSVNPYTGYLLCLRMLNGSGETDWVAPAGNAEHQTAPATAPRPSKDSRSEDDRDTANERFVWNVQTRGTATVPRLPAGYNFKVIEHPSRNDGDDDDTLHDDTVKKPTAATCGDITDGTPYGVTENPTAAPTSQGFTVTHTVARPATPVDVRTTGTTQEILPKIVSLCVQAKYGTDIVGPWSISSSETVEKQNPTN